MLTETEIKIPIYEQKLIVIIYDEVSEIREYSNKRDFGDHLNFHTTRGFVIRIDGVFHMGIFNRFEKDPNNFKKEEVVAHECLHLMHRLFSSIKHITDKHNDEPEAYLMGWLVNQVHQALHKKEISYNQTK